MNQDIIKVRKLAILLSNIADYLNFMNCPNSDLENKGNPGSHITLICPMFSATPPPSCIKSSAENCWCPAESQKI